jgi:hypothetical protein
MKALGDKDAVKCTRTNGNQHKEEIPRKFDADIGYRFKKRTGGRGQRYA